MNKNTAIAKFPLRLIATGLVASFLSSISILIIASPTLAHHPNGGNVPSTFAEGFLSGLGHPVIGIDHLVFVIAIGLLAALSNKLGLIIPMVFALATALGTGIHLQSVDLPLPELVISASVLVMGIFLAKENKTNLALLTVIGAIAGIFHGYAYGESIIGAETIALGAYLLGFCLIQLGISAIAFYLGKLLLKKPAFSSHLPLRFAGFTICGVGFAFLSNAILG
ncbi:HupE/UreJ family protein [Pleurocapsa sp. PCC 7319]|uniref:HupE/UreJ family protein n=1 Tax=Pleurocapsa sp. PCC 7319 TaxID=118161 RepID=UPI0004761A0A|nr:HupE/UreJ family protein [Pleurocapsa sp. PCC 7319]